MSRRPSSVCLSVYKLFAQIASSTRQMAGSLPNLHTMVPRRAYIRGVLKFKVEVKGHLEFHKKNRQLSLSLTSPSLCPFSFLPQPNPQMAVILRCSSHGETVCQTVCAMQYGLTSCLYVRSLYEAPLHSPSRLSIRQLDLKSKSWNELLRH